MFVFCVFFAEELILYCVSLSTHPVQSVVNKITQLSGRGFPCIFHMSLCSSQLYVCFCAPKWKPGRVTFGVLRLMCNKKVSSVFFWIHPVQSVLNNITQVSGRGFPHIFIWNCVFVTTLCVRGT